MKTVTADTCVEITLREREMCGHFGHGLVEDIVEAGELRDVGKDLLRGGDEFQGLGNVDRREMNGGAKLFEELRRDELVGDEFGAAMNDAMADGDGSGVDVIADGFRDGCEGVALGFVDAVAFDEGFARGGANVQGAVVAANALGAAGEEREFVRGALGVGAEFEGGGAAVDYEDEVGG